MSRMAPHREAQTGECDAPRGLATDTERGLGNHPARTSAGRLACSHTSAHARLSACHCAAESSTSCISTSKSSNLITTLFILWSHSEIFPTLILMPAFHRPHATKCSSWSDYFSLHENTLSSQTCTFSQNSPLGTNLFYGKLEGNQFGHICLRREGEKHTIFLPWKKKKDKKPTYIFHAMQTALKSWNPAFCLTHRSGGCQQEQDSKGAEM